MPIKDTFSYIARWDSVGLDCSNCIHFHAPAKWPDVEGKSYCLKHDMSLGIELDTNGFKKGEWFCKSFENDGSAFQPSLEHFKKIQSDLSEDTLYGFYGADGYLLEYNFSTVKAWEVSSGKDLP